MIVLMLGCGVREISTEADDFTLARKAAKS